MSQWNLSGGTNSRLLFSQLRLYNKVAAIKRGFGQLSIWESFAEDGSWMACAKGSSFPPKVNGDQLDIDCTSVKLWVVPHPCLSSQLWSWSPEGFILKQQLSDESTAVSKNHPCLGLVLPGGLSKLNKFKLSLAGIDSATVAVNSGQPI